MIMVGLFRRKSEREKRRSQPHDHPLVTDPIDDLDDKIDERRDEIKEVTHGKTFETIKMMNALRNKDLTVIYKNERIAILRGGGGAKSLIEVIVAFDELTKEGYRLMSTGSAFDLAGRSNMIAGFGGPSGNTFLYFQKF